MKQKKKKSKGVRYWKNKAWEEFSRFIRIRDAIETTKTKDTLVCCTCGQGYPAFGVGCAQAGHFIPGRGNAILFDERGVHGQCYNCNHTLKGSWPAYLEFMKRKYGQEVIDELLQNKNKVLQYKGFELEEIRDKYKMKYEKLKSEPTRD